MIKEKPKSYRKRVDELKPGEGFQFPEEKQLWVASMISKKFHRLTNKQFSVTTEGQPPRTAWVERVDKGEEELTHAN